MLSDVSIRNAKPKERDYKLADFAGLYLVVTKSGGKLWRFDYRISDRRKTLSIGRYPDVGLVAARERLREARSQLAFGTDPSEAKRAQKRAGDDFETLARRWLAKKRPALVPAHFKRVEARLVKDVFPRIGALSPGEIEPPILLRYIREIERRGAIETARRVNGYCGEIFRFGIAEGICSRDPAADIRDALSAPPPVKHQPSLKAAELPEFFAKLATAKSEPVTIEAMLFTIMTAARTSEARFAKFEEFEGLDGDQPLWRLSPQRMKMSRAHLVPLSRQAAEIVKRRLSESSSPFLFPENTKTGTISEVRMLNCLKKLGYHGRATVHGFRSTFSTVANENGWNGDWVELALAHTEGSKVRAAYNAALYLPQRRELLQWWADYLDQQRSAGLSATC